MSGWVGGFESEPLPDLREINSPQVTHHIAVVEEQCGNPSSILRTSYVRIPDPSKPDTHGGEDVTQGMNLESGSGLDLSENIQESKLPSSETPWPLSLRLGEVPDLICQDPDPKSHRSSM